MITVSVMKGLKEILMKLERFMEDSKRQFQSRIKEKATGSLETYSEPSKTSKMELYAKSIDRIQPLIIFAKLSVIGISQSYGCASNKTERKSRALSFISQKITNNQ